MKIRKKEKKSNNALGGGLACSGHFCPIYLLGYFVMNPGVSMLDQILQDFMT